MKFQHLVAVAATTFVGTQVNAQCLEWTDLIGGTYPFRAAAMAYDSVRGVTVMFGGYDPDSGGSLGDTREWDGNEWTTVAVSSGPTPRNYAQMVFDSGRGVMVMFGGKTTEAGDTSLNETWEWDSAAWTLASTSGPSARWGMGLAYDSRSEEVIMHGGQQDGDTYFRDTWSWNGSQWTLLSTNGPLRAGHSMAFDVRSAACLLFGGRDGDPGTIYNELWEWSGSGWNKLMPATGVRPETRLFTGAVYDSSRSLALFWGGFCGGNCYRSDLWCWNGREWIAISQDATPSPRFDHSIAFDSARDRIVLAGGRDSEDSDNPPLADTREVPLTPFPMIKDHPASASVVAGENAEFVCSTSPTGLVYEWQRDGVTLTDNGRIQGAMTNTLRIESVQESDEGEYVCVVTDPCVTLYSHAATLDVEPFVCFADWNQDNTLNTGDFIAFLGDWNAARAGVPPFYGDPDLAEPFGILNTVDFLAYLNLYGAGCP